MLAGLLGFPLTLLSERRAAIVFLPLILSPFLGAVVYAYWLRHRLEHARTHQQESP